jgi:phage terminase large subunit-like protein
MNRIEQLEIYAHCLEDPIFTIETFFKTFDKTQEGYVPFRLFYKQKEIIESYKKYNRNIVTKPRQAGVSTTTAAYIAAICAFGDKNNPHKVLILANKQTLAQEILSKVKEFLDQIPYWVWGLPEDEDYLDINSKGHLKLKTTKCEVRAVATSKDALRGFTPTFLVFDEAAYIDNGDEVFGAALASLGTGGNMALISTPKIWH